MVITDGPDFALNGDPLSAVTLHASGPGEDDIGPGSQIHIKIAKGCRSEAEQGLNRVYEGKEMERVEPPTSEDIRKELHSIWHKFIL